MPSDPARWLLYLPLGSAHSLVSAAAQSGVGAIRDVFTGFQLGHDTWLQQHVDRITHEQGFNASQKFTGSENLLALP